MTLLSTYEELHLKGFVPVRLRVRVGEAPDYLGLEAPTGCIIFKHVVEDKYFPHAAANKKGEHYDEDRLEDVVEERKLSRLEQLLEYLLG